MIDEDIHKAVIERLSGDEYFSSEPAVLVVAQEEPDGDAEDDGEGGEAVSEKVDPSKRINDALNTSGLVVEVLYPDWERAPGGLTTFSGLIHMLENRYKNRQASTGNRRRGRNAARRIASRIDGFLPAIGGERIESLGNTRFIVTAQTFLGQDGGRGLWEIRWELKTRITSLQDFLADENDQPIVDENSENILTAPTP